MSQPVSSGLHKNENQDKVEIQLWANFLSPTWINVHQGAP